jgi:hypothetical protein
MSDWLEQHLIDGHGVKFNWDTYGPDDDSTTGIHNRLHWPQNHPNHSHVESKSKTVPILDGDADCGSGW